VRGKGLDKAKNFVPLRSPLSGEWVFESREACKCQKVRNFVAPLREERGGVRGKGLDKAKNFVPLRSLSRCGVENRGDLTKRKTSYLCAP